jgi:hypothetical protein
MSDNDQNSRTLHASRFTLHESPLSWLREIPIEDLLTNDVKFIHECCGLDILLILWENFAKMTLTISTKPLMEAKKRYIMKRFAELGKLSTKDVKDLCKLLGVGERFVYEALEEKGILHEGQEKLF